MAIFKTIAFNFHRFVFCYHLTGCYTCVIHAAGVILLGSFNHGEREREREIVHSSNDHLCNK